MESECLFSFPTIIHPLNPSENETEQENRPGGTVLLRAVPAGLPEKLRKYHPDKVSDTDLIAEREEVATTTFEKERRTGGTVEHAHEEAMRVLLHGLHFSPYALLREVVENEFADEVAESGREAFCRKLSPAHDLLYTELVGTVMLYLEGGHGVQ